MKTERLENAITNLNNNMKSNKATLFDKDYVKIKKETFNNMNIVINESKKVMEMQESFLSYVSTTPPSAIRLI